MASSNGNGVKEAPLANTEQLARFEELVGNVLLSRSQLFKQMLDPRRDIDDECGYPRSTSAVTADLYQQLYDREAVACRVVQVMPKESWQVQPLVFEDENPKKTTPFEQAWDNLGSQLRGESGWHQDEQGSPVWEWLLRADILSGIGQYGLVLLGVNDGADLNTPAFQLPAQDSVSPFVGQGTDEQYFREGSYYPTPQMRKTAGPRQLLFVRVFPESLVEITQYESNVRSPRFGQPIVYRVTFNDPRNDQATGIGLPIASVNVHWTRCIHVADNLDHSEVFGVPRMRPVLNRLLDLRKLYSGSAEMYWRGAFPGFSLETHPQLGGDVEINKTELRDMMENYMNGLQRYLALSGMSAKSMAPQVSDPTAQINAQLDAVCIQLGIPKRVFVGSERGELASSQDDAAWNDRLRQRQNGYVTPRIIVPFVDRLIQLGVLPKPKAGYSVEWPDLTSQTQQEKASVAVSKTQALAQYVGGGVEAVVPPMEYLTGFLGIEEEEALAILESAAKAAEEKMAEDTIKAEEMAAKGLTPDGQSQSTAKPIPKEGPEEPAVNANPEGCNQYKECDEGDENEGVDLEDHLDSLGMSSGDVKDVLRSKQASDVERLSSVSKEPRTVSIRDIKGLDSDTESGGAIDNPRGLDPIIIGHDGEIIDGNHRVAGLQEGGHGSVKAIVATEEDLQAAKAFGGLQGRGSRSEENWIKWMQSRVKNPTGNANPEGCNQHTGPGCADGGSDLQSARSKIWAKKGTTKLRFGMDELTAGEVEALKGAGAVTPAKKGGKQVGWQVSYDWTESNPPTPKAAYVSPDPAEPLSRSAAGDHIEKSLAEAGFQASLWKSEGGGSVRVYVSDAKGKLGYLAIDRDGKIEPTLDRRKGEIMGHVPQMTITPDQSGGRGRPVSSEPPDDPMERLAYEAQRELGRTGELPGA